MNVYLESSAALRDLLSGDFAEEIRAALRGAELVISSRLTLGEVGRVFARIRILQPELASRTALREAEFLAESETWTIHPIDEAILVRCARPFPVEPVRMLDAVHLATIERVSSAVSELVVISTDDRVRKNAVALGAGVFPPTNEQ